MQKKKEMKNIIQFYFDNGEDPELYFCRNEICQKKIKQKSNSGYSNLKAHLTSCIGPNFEAAYADLCKTDETKQLRSFGFINSRAKEMADLIEWIVMRNIPLSEIDNAITRKVT
jgi:hypothetical protein